MTYYMTDDRGRITAHAQHKFDDNCEETEREIIRVGGEFVFSDAISAENFLKLKEDKISILWNNYKSYQRAKVDPEDLTLAALCASNGSLKGKGVQGWVMMLWEQYYSVRDEINAAATPEALAAINLAADVCGNPPYTIRELNEEAAAFMAGTNGV